MCKGADFWECRVGLDPANRRRVWKVLQEQKKKSTIIMTTHSMEEADLLADCIGVMAKGQVIRNTVATH